MGSFFLMATIVELKRRLKALRPMPRPQVAPPLMLNQETNTSDKLIDSLKEMNGDDLWIVRQSYQKVFPNGATTDLTLVGMLDQLDQVVPHYESK